MNKKLSVLVIATALSAAFCFAACGKDKPAETTAASAAATTAAAQNSEATAASESKGNAQASENGDGIPKVGDMYNVLAADSSHNVKAGDNVVWNGTDWDVLAGLVEFDTITTAQIDALFA